MINENLEFKYNSLSTGSKIGYGIIVFFITFLGISPISYGLWDYSVNGVLTQLIIALITAGSFFLLFAIRFGTISFTRRGIQYIYFNKETKSIEIATFNKKDYQIPFSEIKEVIVRKDTGNSVNNTYSGTQINYYYSASLIRRNGGCFDITNDLNEDRIQEIAKNLRTVIADTPNNTPKNTPQLPNTIK